MRPRAFLPVHGTFVHLKAHAGIARDRGIQEVLMVENGSIVELTPDAFRMAGHVWSGRTHIDRGGEAVEGRVLGERKALAEHGIIVISLRLDERGRAVGLPEVVSRGIVRAEHDDEMIEDLRKLVQRELLEMRSNRLVLDPADVRETAERAVRRFFQRELGRKPIAMVLLHAAHGRP